MFDISPNEDWVKDWKLGVNPDFEISTGSQLVIIFKNFWHNQSLRTKSRTTQRRYSAGLHAIGGDLIAEAIQQNKYNDHPVKMLMDSLSPTDGPLIYLDNTEWQKELDMVARKLFRYMQNSTTNL